MRVLIGCERSGVVRNAFRAKGHDAWSCDLEAADDGSRFHLKCNLLDILGNGWDLGIFHPPCTYFALSGNRWLYSTLPKHKDRLKKREQALKFFLQCYNSPIPKVAIENPVSTISSLFRQPDQIIQPWEFGHTERKTTALWLRNLPSLIPRMYVNEAVDLDKIDRIHQLYRTVSNKKELARQRSVTYLGVALAMADQWTQTATPSTPVVQTPGTDPKPGSA